MKLFAITLLLLASLGMCTHASARTAPELSSDDKQKLEQAFQAASDLLWPHIRAYEQHPKGFDAKSAEKDLREAAAIFGVFIEQYPQKTATYWLKGKAHQLLGEHTQAMITFGQAVKLDPNDFDTVHEYVYECLVTGNAAGAIEAAKHFLSNRPHDSRMSFKLSVAYLIANNYTKATETAQLGLEADPDFIDFMKLQDVIEAVRNGKRKAPEKYADLFD